MNFRTTILSLAAVLGLALATAASAQTQLNEDFTGALSSNNNGVGNWLVSGGACLTAGTQPVAAVGSIPLSIPACVIDGSTDVLGTYYRQAHSQYAGDPYLVGGSNGYLGSTAAPGGTALQSPDAVGTGALRFTNGSSSGTTGHGQNGSIVSANTYSTTAGLQFTFKTVTYHGDSGNGSGADGISFYLLDGCSPLAGTTIPAYCYIASSNPNLTIFGETTTAPANYQQYGAWGGSLAYTCSNSNTPHDGLVGAYLGLGIDEYGNFLNGKVNTQGTAWSASGDNTATGGGYKPSRIGLRGAGNISWQALSTAYGSPYAAGDTTHPFYTDATCASGTYDATLNACESCSSGTYSGQGTGTCTVTTGTSNCPAAPSGDFYTYNVALAAANRCVACPTGQTYSPTTSGAYPNGSCTTTTASSGTLITTATCTGTPGSTYDATTGKCITCPTGSTANGTTGTCSAVTATETAPTGVTCPSGSTYDSALSAPNLCVSCPTGLTLSGQTTSSPACTSATPTETAASGGTCASGSYDAALAKCEACPTGSTLTGGTTATPSCTATVIETNIPGSGICAGSTTKNTTLGKCVSCPAGTTLQNGTSATPSCTATLTTTTPTGETCASGTYDSALAAPAQCVACPTGSTLSGGTTATPSCAATPTETTPRSESCSSGGTYDGALGKCVSCSSGTLSGQTTSSPICSAPTATTANACATGKTLTNNMCNSCSSGTYSPTTSGTYPYGYCTVPQLPDSETASLTTTSTPAAGSTPSSVNANVAQLLVQATCESGHLFNYNALVNTLGAASGWTLGNILASTTPYTGNTTLTYAPDGNGNAANPLNTAGILDYAAIPGGYQVLSGTTSSGTPIQIPNESAMTRSAANTILYNLKITPSGLLSLSYSFNGAAYQSIIQNQSITANNGPLPQTVRYGFAGSTGGASNVHEILCFKSQPVNQAASSVGVNQRQSAEIQPTGSYAYFSFYDTLDWTGRVTANALGLSNGALVVNQTPTWDASCVLTGVGSNATCPTGVPGPTAAEAPGSRVILTYGATGGVPFEAPGTSGGGITAAQLLSLDLGDATTNNLYRLNYLRGARDNELSNSTTPCPMYVAPTTGATPSPGTPCFRPRDSVLGDIVDSSPVWVGPPQYPYTAAWKDKLYSAATAPEAASGAQTYTTFANAGQTRTNVVYVGANDGMLHAFRSGSFNSAGAFDTSSSAAPNDGLEVMAYVPGAVLASPTNGSTAGCVNNPMAATLSLVQNIHGVSPLSGSTAACTAPSLDYSNQNYGHDFYVDATPGTGDLFYNNAWHTWVVGGLGAGGAAIYALDVTNPGTGTTNNFTEANAATTVVGEWTAANLVCALDTGSFQCANSLGNTYGTPIVRRLHDGRWAIIFGNGLGSASGDAGIFVMTISGYNGTTQLPIMTTYYLSTGTGSTAAPNGISYVSSADLDGDHITDFVYAGDLQGNIWRFDLTSQTETTWAVTPGPLFTTPTGQPITTALTVASGSTTAGTNTLMLGFGTGQKNQVTNLAAVNYQSGQQALYGVWDWNMGTTSVGWNSKSATQYASLTAASTGSPSNPPTFVYTVQASQLEPITITQNASAYTAGNGSPLGEDSGTTQAAVCWAGTSGCTGGSGQYGWYLNLPGSQAATSTAAKTYEQIVYNPLVLGTAFVVNSTIPASNSTLQCTSNSDTGYTYAVSVMSGTFIPNFFTESSATQYHDTQAIAEQTNATGTSFPVTTANGQNWLVYQTVGNSPSALQVQLPPNYVGRRLTWVQLR
jgi:type IV pilus assembly protein PilY1